MAISAPSASGAAAPTPNRLIDSPWFALLWAAIRRLLFALLVLLAIVFATFLGMDMAQGKALLPSVQDSIVNTGGYGVDLLHGELGIGAAVGALRNPQPVSSFLGRVFLRSLGLLGVSLLFATLVGGTLGLLAAGRRQGGRAMTLILASIVGVSAPSFFVALFLQILAIRYTRWTGTRLLPVGGFGWDAHLILPGLVLAARPVAQIARMTYVAVGQILETDYIRTATSKGLHRNLIWARHILSNATVPILTTIGLSLRFSLASLPVVELFFGWSGAGQTLLRAIARQDRNTTVALLLCFGALFLLVNLLLDLAYQFLDPRLRQDQLHSVDLVSPGLGGSPVRWLMAVLGDWRHRVGGLVINVARWVRRSPVHPSAQSLVPDPDPPHLNWALWRRATLGNLPLLLGGLLLAGLLGIYLFGPQLSPHSPFTLQGIEYVDGDLIVPPFAPDRVHPWGTDVLGRDIMSLVLAGAQQTLSLAGLAVLARLGLGMILGALAGWFHGRWPDRLILAGAEIIAAFPVLLLAMLLILSLGIRGGFQPFLIGLSLVGWTEIMQFVRSEVLRTRPQPFVESAVAVGAGSPRILWRHLLPNLMPALISLTALEMGAVLMLLGELGFVGIFLGGGAFASVNAEGSAFQFSDVPEWGALLSNVRLYARVYPWTALYPSLSFFVAILGFNFFGEGLRHYVETTGARFSPLWARYLWLGLLVLLLGAGWVRTNTGPLPFYRQQALTFSGEEASAHVQTLAAPELGGRSLGGAGASQSADYIAQKFEDLGLQRAGENQTWFQGVERDFTRLTETPSLVLDGNGPPLTFGADFAASVTGWQGWGDGDGPVTLLMAGPLSGRAGRQGQPTAALRDLDFADGILMLLSNRDALRLAAVPHAGMLIVGDPDTHFNQIQSYPPGRSASGMGPPTLLISEETANRIVASTAQNVAQLRRQADGLTLDQVQTVETGRHAQITLSGQVERQVPAVNVIGHLPATEGQGLGGELVVVMAPYDSPPAFPDGISTPGANDNGSGVALLLEIARAMQVSDYQPYRTFLFVAYSGEGYRDGAALYPPDVREFLAARQGFAANFDVVAAVDLRGVGGGSGERLSINAGASTRLADLFSLAARRVNTPVTRTAMADLGALFDDVSTPMRTQQAIPLVVVQWEGWAQLARTPQDTVGRVDPQKLERAGRAVTLALMVMGREVDY